MQRRRPNPRYQRRPRPQVSETLTVTTTKKHLDINSDVGQGFGINQNHFEEKLLPYTLKLSLMN